MGADLPAREEQEIQGKRGGGGRKDTKEAPCLPDQARGDRRGSEIAVADDEPAHIERDSPFAGRHLDLTLRRNDSTRPSKDLGGGPIPHLRPDPVAQAQEEVASG